MSAFRFSPVLKPAFAIGLVVAMGLGGCTSFRQAMGLEKVTPDEFAIVTKAPLILPPDYNLRPPRPGAPQAVNYSAQADAHNALFGDDADPVADGVVTTGELALLTSTGAADADPAIRDQLASDYGDVVQKDRTFTDRILFWQNDQPNRPAASVVDAAAEAERIRDNQSLGNPVTAGETPTISKDRGIF